MENFCAAQKTKCEHKRKAKSEALSERKTKQNKKGVLVFSNPK